MKIDTNMIEYDIHKGWDPQQLQPVYAVRAQHPDHRHSIGHGVAPTEDDACTAARKNLLALLVRRQI